MIKERSYSLFDQTFSFKTAKNAQFFSNTRYLFTLKKKKKMQISSFLKKWNKKFFLSALPLTGAQQKAKTIVKTIWRVFKVF